MTITCATTEAAVQVLAMLNTARLRVGLDYRADPPAGFGLPITITFMTDLPADVLHQLSAIPDTTIT